ncbi:MAG: hypothetical protein JXR79_00415, partial [Nitrospirae bacterium]|nr:hypothetical protein [Nitrospirota bacterium]
MILILLNQLRCGGQREKTLIDLCAVDFNVVLCCSASDGSAFNDVIKGKGGDDLIDASQGGDDHLFGGDGNDIIYAQKSFCIDMLEGGTGSDALNAGGGDDNAFGESYGEMADLIAAGETAPSIGARGDLVSGGAGNDFVYGADAGDLLMGGQGHDLLVGGGGNDAILGDADFLGASSDWSYTVVREGEWGT